MVNGGTATITHIKKQDSIRIASMTNNIEQDSKVEISYGIYWSKLSPQHNNNGLILRQENFSAPKPGHIHPFLESWETIKPPKKDELKKSEAPVQGSDMKQALAEYQKDPADPTHAPPVYSASVASSGKSTSPA